MPGPTVPNLPTPPGDNQITVEQTIVYQGSSGTLRTVNKAWFDQYELASEKDTLDNGLSSLVSYTYGLGAQVTSKSEYDYGSGPSGGLLRKTVTNYQVFPATPIYTFGASIYDRPCQTIIYDSTGTNRVAETDYFFDGSSNTTPCATATTQALSGSGSYTGHDETNYGTAKTPARANVTRKTQWLSAGSPVTTYSYDETGQVLSSTDPCGNGSCSNMSGTNHTTQYSYADSYTVLSGGSNVAYTPSGNTNAYLTTVTDPLGHTESFTYDFYNGQLTQSTDSNSRSTTYIYNDPFARPTQANYPDGGQTTTGYNDSPYNPATPSPSVKTTTAITSSLNEVRTVASDGIAQTVETVLSSDPDGTTYTFTTHDGLGRLYTSTNPYRTTNDSTYGITSYQYDALGRTTQVSMPDGSQVTTGYAGNQATVTDEVSNERTTQTDALNRLTYVWEAPNNSSYNYETIYSYDPLNNLLSVTQNGNNSSNARLRTFQYDSLSRLTRAVNPESGTILYSYDLDGNTSTRTAPLPNQFSGTVTTNYSYDVLSRLLGKSYVGLSTPASTYFYDQTSYNGLTISNGISRRTGMSDGSGASAWSYDSMGRIAALRRTLNGIANTATYTRSPYLNGEVSNLTYFSGSQVAYTWSGADRALTAIDPYPINFVTAATYSPTGALAGAAFGAYNTGFTGTIVSNSYNNRLQPTVLSASSPSMTVFSLSYNFNQGTGSAPKNNGSVVTIQNNRDNTRTQTFTYDPLNRIAIAETPTLLWGDTYVIDAWGSLNEQEHDFWQGW